MMRFENKSVHLRNDIYLVRVTGQYGVRHWTAHSKKERDEFFIRAQSRIIIHQLKSLIQQQYHAYKAIKYEEKQTIAKVLLGSLEGTEKQADSIYRFIYKQRDNLLRICPNKRGMLNEQIEEIILHAEELFLGFDQFRPT